MWEGKQLTECERPFAGTVAEINNSYDENGLRTQNRMEASLAGFTYWQTTDYYYNGSVLIGMNTGSTVMRFSYDAGGNAVSVDYSTDSGSTFTTYYYLRNAQNDIVKLIDGSGNTVVEYLYDSWGRIIATTGSLANTVGANQPFRYRGYVYDTETQWYYLQSRYYDPATCRFISADVLLSTGQGVIGHNSFAYCLNNPKCYIDNDGTDAWYVYDTNGLAKGVGHAVLFYKYKGEWYRTDYSGTINDVCFEIVDTGLDNRLVIALKYVVCVRGRAFVHVQKISKEEMTG